MRALRNLVLACILLVPIAVVVPGTSASTGSGRFSTKWVSNPDEVSDFWTSRRLAAAQPMPLRQVDPEQLRDSAPPEQGEPYLVEAQGPVGDAEFQSSASTGLIPFTSQEVADPSVEVMRTHGKIFGTMGDQLFECSGTVVNSDNKSVVWTAAHCVYGNGGFFGNLMFVPGYEEGSEPYGRWVAQQLFVPSAWQADEAPTDDYAAVVVAPQPTGELLADVVGARGIAFNQQPNEAMQSYGYPALPSRLFDGEHLHTCASTGSWRILKPMIATGCDMKQGSSGGGWVIRGEYVWTVTSIGIPDLPRVQFGPYLGDDARDLYDLARGGTQVFPQPSPTVTPQPHRTHRMRISFNVDRHLIGRGRIQAVSGFQGCAYLGAVQVVKVRVDSQGNASIARFFKVTLTRRDGSYRVKLPDRAGYYGAILYEGGYNLYNDCGQKLSALRRHRH